MTLAERITEYLSSGGLFNPEYSNHAAAQELLIDCRAGIEELERQLAEAEKQARIFYAQGEERGRIIEETRRQLAEALRALNIICRMDAENFPTAYARCVDTAAAAIRALEGQT